MTLTLTLHGRLFLGAAIAGLVIMAGGQTLYAQTETVPDTVETFSNGEVYEPAYFETYQPRTAIDMVRRIPGFSVRGGNNNGRGLGQGGANVLINGARISGKSTSPRDALGRIPAKNVVRIEIVEGETLDIAGLSGQVANVITKNTGVTGTWRWQPEFRQGRRPTYERGNASVTGSKRNLNYTIGLNAGAFHGGAEGRENVTDADGTLYEFAEERSEAHGQNPKLTLELNYTPKPDHIANLNLSYAQFNFNSDEVSRRQAVTARGVTQLTLFDRYEDEKNGEISADYVFPLSLGPVDGTLKLIGVSNFEDSPTRNRFREFVPGATPSESMFFFNADEGETIGRAEYSWVSKQGSDWQLSAETAFNFLDIESQLFETNAAGALVEEILDDPKARVEERRSEVTLTHNRKLSEKLDIQASLGVEQSEISQTGAGNNEREFIRPKGFLKTTYAWDDTLDIRTEIERRVGQLNFFDFISSVDIADERDQSGNSDLVPVQFWNYVLEFDKDFGQGNTALLRLFYENIEDIVDRIPLEDGGDAVGNIDTAFAYGVILESTLKGDRWGFEGTELNFEYSIQLHEVEDPLTFEPRRINNRTNSFVEFNFRHDIPKTDWAYGFGLERFRRAPGVRLEEISVFRFRDPFSNIFIEHKDVFGLKVQARLLNLFNARESARRDVYEGRRDETDIDFIQDRNQTFETFVRFTISGEF